MLKPRNEKVQTKGWGPVIFFSAMGFYNKQKLKITPIAKKTKFWVQISLDENPKKLHVLMHFFVCYLI